MKTRITLLMSALLVLTLVFTGCSKNGDYENVIPKDAGAVISIDLKSIVEKCDLSDTENRRTKFALKELVSEQLSPEAEKKLKELISSPSETGIDFMSPIYIFGSSKFDDVVYLMHVADSKKLKNTLKIFVRENICQKMDESDGYTFTVMGNHLLMFSNSALVAAPFSGHSAYEELKKSVADLLDQKNSNSFASNKVFNKLKSRGEDVKFYISMELLSKDPDAKQLMSMMNVDADLSQMAQLGGLNFGKGDISIQTVNYTEDSEVENLLKKQYKAAETISRDYLKYFPKSTIAFASLGIDGKKAYDIIADNDMLTKLIPFISTESGKSIISSFDGDVSIGLTDMSVSGMPTILAYAKMKNTKLLDVLYDGRDYILNSGVESIEKQGRNQYVYKAKPLSLTIYYGMKKKNFYATNDKELFDNIFKEDKSSIEDAEYAKDIKGKSSFIVFNVQEIIEMPILKMALGMGDAETKMVYTVASKVDYVELSSTTNGTSDIRIVLTDKETNSLRQIADLVGDFVGLQ
jgi:hypothetical protein